MQQLNDHISNIHLKVQDLVKKHQQTLKEAEIRQQVIRQLKEENDELKSKLDLLEQQCHVLKSSAGKMEGPDKKAFEQLLNSYIRDIDKCINQLNS